MGDLDLIKILTAFTYLLACVNAACEFETYTSTTINIGRFNENLAAGTVLKELIPKVGTTLSYVVPVNPAALAFFVFDENAQTVKIVSRSFELYLESTPQPASTQVVIPLQGYCNGNEPLNFNVVLNIDDVNDHCPKFEKEAYGSSVTTRWPASIPLSGEDIVAIDIDYTRQHADLQFTSGNPKVRFDVIEPPVSQRVGPWAYKIVLKLLDENTQLSLEDQEPFTISVSDGVCTTTTEYTFEVEKINLFPPIFEKASYTLEIDHCAEPGEVVGVNILATDAEDSEFIYLIGDTTRQILDIDPATGQVTFNTPITPTWVRGLGKHKKVEFELIAQETEEPVEKQLSSKSVLTLFFDCQDPPTFPPKFSQVLYEVDVDNLPAQGSVLNVNVVATDEDATPFVYLTGTASHPGVVGIDRLTGVVTFGIPITKEFIKGMGNRKSAQIELIARETVAGVPDNQQLMGRATLIIYFNYQEEPVAGNTPPIFQFPRYTLEIEGLPGSGTGIPANIRAADAENSPFAYTIILQTKTIVRINSGGDVFFTSPITADFVRSLGRHKMVQIEIMAKETDLPESTQLYSTTVLTLLFNYVEETTGSPCVNSAAVVATTPGFQNGRKWNPRVFHDTESG